jgi:hypothetical protein
MTKQYMSGEERSAQEDAELQAAEKAFNDEFGAPDAQAQATSDEPVEEQSQEPAVDWEKRYKDLQSHHDKTTNELKQRLAELGEGAEPTTEDEVKKLREQLEALQGKESARELEAAVAQAQAAVGQAHPDFVSVINSPEFAEWVKGQPQVYQDAIYADRPDASLAIDAITLFKVQGGSMQRQAAQEQQKQMEQAAMTVNGGHREAPQASTEKTWTWAEIQSLSAHDYDKLEAEIDKAIRDGRVR